MGEEDRECIFCKEGVDKLEHFVGDCETSKALVYKVGKECGGKNEEN